MTLIVNITQQFEIEFELPNSFNNSASGHQPYTYVFDRIYNHTESKGDWYKFRVQKKDALEIASKLEEVAKSIRKELL